MPSPAWPHPTVSLEDAKISRDAPVIQSLSFEISAFAVFAGSDTTAVSTRAIIYYLLKNPQAKQKLIQEIDGLRKQGKLSDPVKLKEADDMPYLQAVMYEALR